MISAGTRPEIIKLAPVFHAAEASRIGITWVDTGQHDRQITEALYAFFGVEVALWLNIRRDGSDLGELNAGLLGALAGVLREWRADLVMVQGDTASALQSAIAGFFAGLPVAHVEAGLRSGDLRSPFPEEFNRAMIARFARWNFAPTQAAMDALRREGAPGQCLLVGNTIVDALRLGKERLSDYQRRHPDAAPARWLRQLERRKLILVTAHRRENWGEGIRGIAEAVRRLLEAHDCLACLWVLHPNASVAASVREAFAQVPQSLGERLILAEAQPYVHMLWLLDAAWLLLSDSGGIQEEAVSLGVPILITRRETERPEVLACGCGGLVGTDSDRIIAAVQEHLAQAQADQGACAPPFNPFGDGYAAQRILEHLQ